MSWFTILSGLVLWLLFHSVLCGPVLFWPLGDSGKLRGTGVKLGETELKPREWG